MKKFNIDIIIVNWNSGSLLTECIKSILDSDLENIGIKIFIIDNNSKDGSQFIIKENENVININNEKNIGFGAACNQGIKMSSSPFVLFLNPDTRLFKNTLINALEFFNSNADISILGVQHVDEQDRTLKSCSRIPSAKNYFYDITGLSKVLPSVFKPATIMTDWDHATSRNVEQVMGAFMLLRRSLFQEIGTFDEDFFVYYEDLDLSKRVLDAGGRIFYNADIKIFHKGQGTTAQVKDKRLFYSMMSRLIFIKKHYKFSTFIIVLTLTLLFEPATRLIKLILTFRFKEILKLLKGYFYLITNLLKNLH